MISIRKSATELERLETLLRAATEGYGQAIGSTAQYAVEIDPGDVQLFRQRLEALREQVAAAAEPEHWETVQTAFRGELRDYRDKSAAQIERMRADIKAAAEAVQMFAESVASSGQDHEQEIQQELAQLKSALEYDDLRKVRAAIASAVGNITASVAQMQRSHQLVVAQLRDEMRLLHKKIDAERRVQNTDPATGLWNRQRLDQLIAERLQGRESFCVLLVRLRNLKRLQTAFCAPVIESAVKALLERLAAMAGDGAIIGHWDAEHLAVLLEQDQASAIVLSREATAKLSSIYTVQENGVWHRVALQAVAGVVDRPADGDVASFEEKLIQMSDALLNA